jgi:hypothetical protein
MNSATFRFFLFKPVEADSTSPAPLSSGGRLYALQVLPFLPRDMMMRQSLLLRFQVIGWMVSHR